MKKILFLSLVFCFVSWDWEPLSLKIEPKPEIKIQAHWSVDTVTDKSLRSKLINNSPPLITKKWVIQANALDGVKAYDKKTGRLIWNFYIPSGVSSPLLLHKQNIYFGGRDGFFYSLKLSSGLLNWKYFISSESASQPIVFKERIYLLSQNQKVYAFSVKGEMLWIHSHSSSSRNFNVKGNSRPVIFKDQLYVAFQDGEVVALNKKTSDVKWKTKLSRQAIISPLKVDKNCLLVPVFLDHLYCLNLKNKKVLWKVKGGSASQLNSTQAIYQAHKSHLYAYKHSKNKGQMLWKKKLDKDYIFAPTLFKDYLIYGFSSKGVIKIVKAKEGSLVNQHLFGRGLAAPIAIDTSNNSLYFFTVDAHLHKISLQLQTH